MGKSGGRDNGRLLRDRNDSLFEEQEGTTEMRLHCRQGWGVGSRESGEENRMKEESCMPRKLGMNAKPSEGTPYARSVHLL